MIFNLVTADQNSPSPEPPQISVADVLILNRPSPPERNDEVKVVKGN